jgi:hypothetical protein
MTTTTTTTGTDTFREHAPVFGADGVRLGTVDRVEGERIKLTREGSGTDQHRWLARSLVERADAEGVRLSVTAAEAMEALQGEAAVQSPFGEDRPAGMGGPFTGTGGRSEAHRDDPEAHRSGEPGPRPDKPLPKTPSRNKDRDMRR